MSNVIHIYAAFASPRLQYILNWIFTDRLGLEWHFYENVADWKVAPGAKLCYAAQNECADALYIKPQGLLAEYNIEPQQLHISRWKHSTILFYNQPGATIPFDIFAASFYLISRYEEYLPYDADRHGRFPKEASVAFQYAFLEQPVIDEWISALAKLLEKKFGLRCKQPSFTFEPSYDIDLAWKYRYRSAKRHMGAYLRSTSLLQIGTIIDRTKVLCGQKQDPYYCFDKMDDWHRKYNLQPRYFFLLGEYGTFDKNVDPHHPAMQSLLRSIGSQYEVGIHPSYGTHTKRARLREEINILSSTLQQPITHSRQHYIKFTIPNTYRRLIEQGITDDYSMGYASANGFRAGTSNAFLWFDLEENSVTNLVVHPFAFMDATAKFYDKLNIEAAYRQWERLYHAIKKVNGTLSCIWHNYILSNDRPYKGWDKLYERCLALIDEDKDV
jgi:hypothetical protein